MSVVMSNARWIGLSQAVRVAGQLISITILARLLPPDAYGLMAMAGVVVNLGYLLRDLGTGAAIIQSPQIPPSLISTVHWTNLSLGITLGVVIAALAPLAAHVFHEPGVAPVLQLLAFVFPLAALGVVRQALLERASRFAPVATIEILSTLVALAAAIVLAFSGLGVLALVAQVLLAAGLTTLGLAAVSAFRPQLVWCRRDFAAVAGFSGRLTLFNGVLYLARNADSAVIGRLLGVAPLGFYSLAYRVMLFPVQNLTYVASRALFPALSRQGTAHGGELYLKSVAFIAFITAPLMAGLFVLREPFVAVVFGPRWAPAVDVIAWLAPVGFIQSVVSSTGTVFMAAGRSGLLLALGGFSLMLQVIAFVIGARWGIEGVAACYLVANLLNAIPALGAAANIYQLPYARLARAILLPAALAVAMALVVSLLQATLLRAGGQMLLILIAGTAVGIAVYGLTSRLMRPQLAQLQLLLRFR